MTFKGPLQHKPSYDSMISAYQNLVGILKAA